MTTERTPWQVKLPRRQVRRSGQPSFHFLAGLRRHLALPQPVNPALGNAGCFQLFKPRELAMKNNRGTSICRDCFLLSLKCTEMSLDGVFLNSC